jgi:hypothetical protein
MNWLTYLFNHGAPTASVAKASKIHNDQLNIKKKKGDQFPAFSWITAFPKLMGLTT